MKNNLRINDMKNILSAVTIAIISVFQIACGDDESSSSNLTDHSGRQECEVVKVLSEIPGSQFPATEPNVFHFVGASAQAVCLPGGFGWSIASWNLTIEVEVKNLDFEKRFVFQDAAGTIWDRVVLDPSDVIYLGNAENGYEKFRLTQKVGSLSPVKLSVIMPAVFNATPNIGNPMPGWTGPTYGLTIAARI